MSAAVPLPSLSVSFQHTDAPGRVFLRRFYGALVDDGSNSTL